MKAAVEEKWKALKEHFIIAQVDTTTPESTILTATTFEVSQRGQFEV